MSAHPQLAPTVAYRSRRASLVWPVACVAVAGVAFGAGWLLRSADVADLESRNDLMIRELATHDMLVDVGVLHGAAQVNHCVTPGCTSAAQSRGLCHTCYVAASRAVAAGKTTWAELEASGAALASKKGARAGLEK